MRRFRKTSVCLWIVVIMLLAITTPGALAGTEGEEPGAGCPNNDSVTYQFVPSPYRGTFTAYLENGNVNVVGHITQMGNPQCFGDIPDSQPFNYGPLPPTLTFSTLRPHDFSSVCISDSALLENTDRFNCPVTPGFVDVVGVGKLTYNSQHCQELGKPDCFSTDVITMWVRERVH